jgi:hypothetical protein
MGVRITRGINVVGFFKRHGFAWEGLWCPRIVSTDLNSLKFLGAGKEKHKISDHHLQTIDFL